MRPPANAHGGSQPNYHTVSSDDEDAGLLGDGGEDTSVHDGHSGPGGDGGDAPPGVQGIEAATAAWTKTSLVFAYIMIWLAYLVEGILSGTAGILTPYVTSAFALHSLTPTTGILSSVVGGITNLTLAKALDVFGRPQGYLVCIVLATAGLAAMAASSSVQAYAAAQVLQAVGNSGIQYSLAVFVADTSSLRSRGLMQAVVTSPNLVTCWLAGPVSAAFLDGPGWRWAFAAFALLVPAVTLPLFKALLDSHAKARMLGLLAKSDEDGERSALQTLVYYGWQFDAVGLVLLSVGTAAFLVPFNMYALQGWSSPLVAGMLVVGSVLIAAFGVWERRYASTTLMPYRLLLDRTVLGTCILSATLFVSFWCWNSFFSSYLQVVNGLSVKEASYVVQSYTVCAVVCSIAVGALIHHTGRFKPVCLYVGIPLSVVGSGLMQYFSSVESGVGYIVLCQICISIGAGTITVCDEVAILSAVSHQHAAVCLAVLGMFGNLGGAVGLTVASALWQGVFPQRLGEYLPAQELPNLHNIYANISAQLSYPVGSETRVAIQHAYRDAQGRMLAVGTAVWAVGLVGVLLWRNISVLTAEKSKGYVW